MKTRPILIALLSSCLSAAAQSAPPATPAAPKPDTNPAVVTRAQLESRLAQLKQIHDQALAQLNALDGAEQEIEHLIQMVTPPPPKQVLNPAPRAK